MQSYAEDWMTAWCDETPPTRDDESKIYSELASGAESGYALYRLGNSQTNLSTHIYRWDYTARWMGDPSTLPEDRIEQMRRVQIRRIIPVDLNSILHRCHALMADLYQLSVDDESPYAWQHKRRHEKAASNLKEAVLDLHWDESKSGFYDFELDYTTDPGMVRTGKTGSIWSGAALAPFWNDIWPESVRSDQQKAMEAFSGMRDLLKRQVNFGRI